MSILELLHPDGVVKRPVVVGTNCPPQFPSKSLNEPGDGVDLVLLTPTVAECRINGWLEKAVQLMTQRLAADGVAYVMAPAAWRSRIKKLLQTHGLLIGPAIVHLPDPASNRLLLPLDPVMLRYVVSNLVRTSLWKRRLAIRAFQFFRSEKFLLRMLPSVGFVGRRVGARPLFDWLFRLDGDIHRPRGVVATTSWRGTDDGVVLHRFSGSGARPSAVAKVFCGTMAGDCTCEAAVLARLGPAARNSGADVPEPLVTRQIGNRRVLLQTAVGGQSVAALLASKPNRLMEVIACVGSWLECWNHSSMVVKPLDADQMNRKLLAPAALLAPLLQQGEEYMDWLKMRCAGMEGVSVPLVSTHNDLTMWNVFLDEQGGLGVVDWKTGREEGLPLVDFLYAVTDAVAAAHDYSNRPRAFEASFAPEGTHMPAVAQIERRLRDRVQVPVDFSELCFHACWVHHAANEHRSSKPSEPRPFLEIVRWLAMHRSLIRSWVNG
jgi:hypothetical protein